jgi:superfamily II DNA helicase RecQ
MMNQVQALENLGIRAAMLTSKTPDQEKADIEKDMKSGHPRIRLLYITPERLAMDRFQNLLKKVHSQNELSRLVIDEAHCISEVRPAQLTRDMQADQHLPQWGHNFRKEYQQIGRFRELFPSIPIMALTASATKKYDTQELVRVSANDPVHQSAR